MSSNPVAPIAPVIVADTAIAPPARRKVVPEEIIAWAVVGTLAIFIIVQHLVSAFIVGLTLYLLLDNASKRIGRRFSGSAARPLALLFVAVLTGALVTGGVLLAATLLRRNAALFPDMLNQMAEILGSVRLWLGGLGRQFIPEVMTDADDLRIFVAGWLKNHAQQFRAGGLWIGVGVLHVIMGVLLAVLVFFRHATHHDEQTRGPLARYLVEKIDRFAHAFSSVAIAQIKISAVNTTLTGLYLLVGLPLFDIHIPFATTLVLITFICGLIPVLGNLISNTFITILSMGVSVGVAVASLSFLIIIHKLEYLINSRIVGGETDSQAWEILMAIIIGEAAFGVSGIVMAPILYAFVKRELRDRALV